MVIPIHNKIAIVGPESTGKTTLTKKLAAHYHSNYVEEEARSYVAALKKPCTLNDIEEIAKLQLKKENHKKENAGSFLFCDTNLLVTKVWAEHAFGICPTWILQNWKPENYKLHLLMNVDLPWEMDEQREHPHLRYFFFQWYERELISSGANYKVISGIGSSRFSSAIEAIEAIKLG